MQELSDLWRFGSFAVAGPARPLNSLGYSSGPLIRNSKENPALFESLLLKGRRVSSLVNL